MGWWPFGGNSSSTAANLQSTSPPPPTSRFDQFVPPPPGGSPFAEPPPPPPPNATSAFLNSDKFIPANNSTTTGWTKDGGENDYSYDDLKKYVSPYLESNALDDEKYMQYEPKSSFADRILTTPRSRNCYENIKQGLKMGAAVGGIFGTFSGLWVAFAMRNVSILPLSIIGGAGSFGFFLACGQLVRCDDSPRFNNSYNSTKYASLHLQPPTHSDTVHTHL